VTDRSPQARPSRDLLEGVRAGDRRALGRAITLVESTRDDHREEALDLLDAVLPSTGDVIRLGVSGPPGVGKSTFIDALGLHIIGGSRRVAVLAVDPSSARSGGSILGDKTRMSELARRPEAFIRPSPAGRTLGGVARRTREAMLLCEAAGHDVVLVETVGVGQSEIAVAGMVDLCLLLVPPAGGDELQGIKRGIVELADVIAVNKADGDLEAAARRTQSEYAAAVRLLRPPHEGLEVEVVACSALTGAGIPALWEAITARWETLRETGALERGRRAQTRDWLWAEVRDGMLANLAADGEVHALEARVAAGELSAARAAQQLLAAQRRA
jgi:LAO/AO transport system kinase